VTVDPKLAQDVFLLAVELTSASERTDLLDRECGADLDLRRRVEALLLAHDAPDSVLDPPFVDPRPQTRSVPAATEPATGSAGRSGPRLRSITTTARAIPAGRPLVMSFLALERWLKVLAPELAPTRFSA
jgi:hypothetical protein